MKSKRSENTNSKFNKEILNYLSDNLSQEEMYAFEKQLHEDDFDFEAMEGFEDFDANEISADKNHLNELLSQKPSGKKKVFYYRIAGVAAVGLILVLLVNQFFVNDLRKESSLMSEEVQLDKKETAQELDVPPELPDERVQELVVEKSSEKENTEENITSDIAIKDEIKEVVSEDDEVSLDIETTEILSDAEVSLEEKEVNEQPVKVETKAMAKASKSVLVPSTSRSEIKDLPTADFVATGYSTGDSEIIIRGKVVDISTEEPLPGVNLVMEEAKLGTMTDMNGEFQIKVPSKYVDKSLKVNYIGFVSEQIPVDKDTSLVVGLTEDILALDEVVVVGYGVDKKKRNETGSVSIVEMPEGKAPVEEAAQPVMGFPEYRKYLKNNIIVPESLQVGKTERVKVKVTIHKDSQIRRVDILSSPGEEFSDEAIRLLLEGPEWKAKTVNGKPETSEVTLKIKFKKLS